MPTTKGPQSPGDELSKSPNGSVDQLPAPQVSADQSETAPEFEVSARYHDSQISSISWWRGWLQRFLAEFHVSAPQKQVEQIYQITATLAVIGSVIAGLWAGAEYFWPDKPETAERAISAKLKIAPKLSIVVLLLAATPNEIILRMD